MQVGNQTVEFGRVFLNAAGEVIKVEVVLPGGKKAIHVEAGKLQELPPALQAPDDQTDALAKIEPSIDRVAKISREEDLFAPPGGGFKILGEIVSLEPRALCSLYQGKKPAEL